MKLKALSSAVAILMLGTGGAYAHPPTTVPDIEIWLAGATAQDPGIEQLFADLCVSGTFDQYQDNANPAKKGAQHKAYFCTIDSSLVPGLVASNPKVLLHKRSAGGSGIGVEPVASGTAVAHMVINNGNCSVSGTNLYDCTISNPGDTGNHVSDAGASDVDPAMFVGVNTPSGFNPMTPALIAKLDVTATAGLVFNTPVTLTLRNALQHVQFGGTVCDPANGAYPANAETQACMPSLSIDQVAALMAGSITRWSDLKVNGVSLTAAPGVTAPDSALVNICRRVNGSGTQATTNTNFLRVPCTPGARNPASTSNNITGPVVVLNSGSGDVEICLDDFNDGTNAGGNNSLLRHNWAIGVQSTEYNVSNALNYRYIKIDGFAPTIANAATGKYVDWAENTFQWRKVSQGGPTGDVLTLLQKMATDNGKPTTIANNLNPNFVYSWGQGGYLALVSNGNNVTNPFSNATPVTQYSHTAGGSINNCAVPLPIQSKPADL